MSTTTVERPPELAEADPVLLGALAILRGGWGREQYHRPASRNPLLRLLGWRDRYCVVGAISMALGQDPEDWSPLDVEYADVRLEDACRRMGFATPGEAIGWNDFEARSKREVLERVERAAYGL